MRISAQFFFHFLDDFSICAFMVHISEQSSCMTVSVCLRPTYKVKGKNVVKDSIHETLSIKFQNNA